MFAPVACVPVRLSVHNRKKTQKDGSKDRPFLLCDGRMPKELLAALEAYGQTVRMPSYEKLPIPVCAHPDLLCFYDGKVLFTFAEYYEAHRALFDTLPVTIMPLILEAGAYPNDLHFDQLLYKGHLIGRAGCIPTALAERYPCAFVKQGYARCSALPFGGQLLTADGGIARAARALGGTVLELTAGSIVLAGYDYGFIGGAGTVIGEQILFFGDLCCHPEGEKIEAFAKAHGFACVSLLKDTPLGDYGGCTVIEGSSEL